MWYLSSWRDLRRRSNAGHGLGNKPEITPPSHSYHRPDGTSDLDDEDKAELAGLRAASTTLSQAVSTAEEHAKGRAVSGGLEETRSEVVWEVIVAANGAAWTVIIDPRTGRVVSSNAKT